MLRRSSSARYSNLGQGGNHVHELDADKQCRDRLGEEQHPRAAADQLRPEVLDPVDAHHKAHEVCRDHHEHVQCAAECTHMPVPRPRTVRAARQHIARRGFGRDEQRNEPCPREQRERQVVPQGHKGEHEEHRGKQVVCAAHRDVDIPHDPQVVAAVPRAPKAHGRVVVEHGADHVLGRVDAVQQRPQPEHAPGKEQLEPDKHQVPEPNHAQLHWRVVGPGVCVFDRVDVHVVQQKLHREQKQRTPHRIHHHARRPHGQRPPELRGKVIKGHDRAGDEQGRVEYVQEVRAHAILLQRAVLPHPRTRIGHARRQLARCLLRGLRLGPLVVERIRHKTQHREIVVDVPARQQPCVGILGQSGTYQPCERGRNPRIRHARGVEHEKEHRAVVRPYRRARRPRHQARALPRKRIVAERKRKQLGRIAAVHRADTNHAHRTPQRLAHDEALGERAPKKVRRALDAPCEHHIDAHQQEDHRQVVAKKAVLVVAVVAHASQHPARHEAVRKCVKVGVAFGRAQTHRYPYHVRPDGEERDKVHEKLARPPPRRRHRLVLRGRFGALGEVRVDGKQRDPATLPQRPCIALSLGLERHQSRAHAVVFHRVPRVPRQHPRRRSGGGGSKATTMAVRRADSPPDPVGAAHLAAGQGAPVEVVQYHEPEEQVEDRQGRDAARARAQGTLGRR